MSNDRDGDETTAGNSRFVASNQSGLHESLEKTVRKHLEHRFRKPIADRNRAAFEPLDAIVQHSTLPLILDSGCGTGLSSRNLRKLHPDCLIIGIDKSAHRLDKLEGPNGDNCHTVQADLIDFWRLAEDARWRPLKHYLLYPNPWPKSAHLQRRWHGSALFPTLLSFGGQLELRSNWQIYIAEFARSLEIAGFSSHVLPYIAEDSITPFEQKYAESQHSLWRLTADLSKDRL